MISRSGFLLFILEDKDSFEGVGLIWSKAEGYTCHAVAEGHMSVIEGALDYLVS